MSAALDKVLRRMHEDAEDIMNTATSAKQVLDSLVMELAPTVMAYKMKGTVPSIQALTSAATKLVAIVAATHESSSAQSSTMTQPPSHSASQAGVPSYASK